MNTSLQLDDGDDQCKSVREEGGHLNERNSKKEPVTMNIALSEKVVEKKQELLVRNSIRSTGAHTSGSTDVSLPTYPRVATEQEQASDTHVRVATVMLT